MKKAAAETIPAAEEIYERYAAPVSRLCARMIRNRETAREAAQEVWFEVVRSLPSFEGRSSTATWLWTIARRTAFRYLKKEKTYSTRFLGELFALPGSTNLMNDIRRSCTWTLI